MENSYSSARDSGIAEHNPISLNSTKTNKFLLYLIVFSVMLFVCMTLFSPIPANLKLMIRLIFIVIFFLSLKLFQSKELSDLKNLSFAFMSLNIAFLVVSLFTVDFWHLKPDTASGLALVKFSDSAIISIVLIICFAVFGFKPRSIYLTSGRLVAGLITGILFFILFGYLALNNPQAKIEPGFLSVNLKWILLFVFSNSFMEELIFRGIFLERLNRFFKPGWSVLLTSICFAIPHLIVNYQSNVLLFSGIVFGLGMICGFAMQYTRSIIAPMLIHAGADLMIMVPIFVSFGVIN